MKTHKVQNIGSELFPCDLIPILATTELSFCSLELIIQLKMAGKRKRADTLGVGEVEGGQVNEFENFQEWLADIMEILRE